MDSSFEATHELVVQGSPGVEGFTVSNSGGSGGRGYSGATGGIAAAAPSTLEPSSFLGTSTATASTAPPLDSGAVNHQHSAGPSSSQHSILHAHRQTNNPSKLPAYRFADLNKEVIGHPSSTSQPQQEPQQQAQQPRQLDSQSHQHRPQKHHQPQSQPQQQQPQYIPPSPVSLDLDQHPETHPSAATHVSPPIPDSRPRPSETINTSNNNSILHSHSSYSSPIVSPAPPAPETTLDSRASRPSFLQTRSSSQAPAASSPSPHVKRSASLDFPSVVATAGRSPSESTDTTVTVRRRATGSVDASLAQGPDGASGGEPADAATRDWAAGQRELLLPKTLQRSLSDDKRASLVKRPPVSYKAPVTANASGGVASIPPIRAFRTSGERRSFGLDMNLRSSRTSLDGDDYGDSGHRDRSLRALEGRRVDDYMQLTPPDSAGPRPDGEESIDPFMKIAREDSYQRPSDGSKMYAENSALTRVARTARRPLSVAISSYRSPSPPRRTSPPRASRRLSEHETTRPRGLSHDQGERTGPPVSYRGHSREPQSEDLKLRSNTGRAPPITPRAVAYHELGSEPTSAHHRRRQPSVDVGSAVPSRMTSLKQASVNYSHPRAYSSSPLVPKSTDPQKYDTPYNEPNQMEGTDSTTSTADASSMWDEFRELKSRMQKLELRQNIPPTSSAAMSRSSDERPTTANTNATTLSASPKRGASSVVQATEPSAPPKESHPLLHSALAKSKDVLPSEVYDALETATVDALALATLMGTAGQPGPISSGRSEIGSNGGTSGGTVTDRQLRRKADSVCRSLTELCLALSENMGATKPQQAVAPLAFDEDMTVTSPTVTQQPTNIAATTMATATAISRRSSIPVNRALELTTSPRAASRFEEKRASTFAPSGLPSPRYSSNIAAAPIDTTAAGRKTSLLLARTRRAGTEEPEDGRRTSTMFRTRRAGTEEPEDYSDRKPLVIRGRRSSAVDDGEDDSRFRTPSRAVTEVNGTRSREYSSFLPAPPLPKEAEALATSALPRRRMASTTINTRVAQPSVITTTASSIATPNRRYFDRSTPTRETSYEEKPAEDRVQRHFSLARAGSQNRRTMNRQSMIAMPPSTTSGYR
ncbi:hypothetical protein GGR57DRAFT_33356 [Xylariaceae sp. FL1272]|nr:hypothetical protein GGR57DRAFT_33356 [Xylariaceae sp. FL1272]